MAGSLGGPLQLQDEGSFFVNGQQTASTHPGTAAGGISQPGTITVNQMYVQYRIPQEVRGPAIVMVHGSGHTGATYETTPDGREGWATYFARKGFPVYVVDHSGRGRSGFNPTAINRARAESNARARLVLLSHRCDLPDAISRRAVSGRGLRSVHRAARA
jgi:pimeloyl-ACP methyl ester carboxylesterase